MLRIFRTKDYKVALYVDSLNKAGVFVKILSIFSTIARFHWRIFANVTHNFISYKHFIYMHWIVTKTQFQLARFQMSCIKSNLINNIPVECSENWTTKYYFALMKSYFVTIVCACMWMQCALQCDLYFFFHSAWVAVHRLRHRWCMVIHKDVGMFVDMYERVYCGAKLHFHYMYVM